MNPLVLVVDDEPDVEDLFRQQFKRDIRAGRFTMEFAGSGDSALQKISDANAVPLASGRFSLLLASEIELAGRAPANRDRIARADPADEHREPISLSPRSCICF
jgi:CheY-like chemotaxis protein